MKAIVILLTVGFGILGVFFAYKAGTVQIPQGYNPIPGNPNGFDSSILSGASQFI